MTTVNEEEEEGIDREMLKSVAATGDPDNSPSGFNSNSQFLARDYKHAPEKVKIKAIEKTLSLCNHTWRFLVDLDSLTSKVACEGVSLDVSLFRGAGLCAVTPQGHDNISVC